MCYFTSDFWAREKKGKERVKLDDGNYAMVERLYS
jgi:hypothetical protein